jgi:hypothetical protein
VSRRERITKELIVEPGTEANIAGRDPGWTGGPEFEELSARQLSGMAATSTPWAPWYVIPADHKPVMQAMVAAILVDTIGSLDLSWPEVSEQARVANAEARRNLAAEPEDAPGGP